jgi:hypothetical protein
MTSPETNIPLKELIRNNCSCVFPDCAMCKIEKGMILAFKEWLNQKRFEIIKEDKIYCADVNAAFNKLFAELKT